MKEYNIYITDYKKTKVLQLPILPSTLPTISKSIANESFETYDNGTFNFIEKAGLTTLTLEGWLPMKTYSFAKSKTMATDFIALFNNAIDTTAPIQLLITCNDNSTYLNDKFSIETFEYGIRKNGDYNYNLGLKQWREYSTKTYVLGWNQDATGWWYCTDVASYTYYKDSWQLIDGEWYSFDSDGYARQSTWIKDKGIWYYLKDNCMMSKSEWVTVDGKSYCFNASGALYVNTTTPDGYVVDSNGAWVEG